MSKQFHNTSLNNHSHIKDVLWSILNSTVNQLEYEDCIIYLLDNQSKLLHQCAALGPKRTNLNQILNPITIPLGRGIVGHAAKSMRAVLVNDTRNYDDYILDLKPGLSEIAAPIIYNNQLLGVIDTESTQADYYSSSDLIILRELGLLIANTIAAELHRDNLYNLLSAKTKQKPKPIQCRSNDSRNTIYPLLGNDIRDQLTQTELSILAEIAKSKTSKEIARALNKSHRTVEVHRQNICKKLGIKGPNALIHYVSSLRSH